MMLHAYKKAFLNYEHALRLKRDSSRNGPGNNDNEQLTSENIYRLPGFREFEWPSTKYVQEVFGPSIWDPPTEQDYKLWAVEKAHKEKAENLVATTESTTTTTTKPSTSESKASKMLALIPKKYDQIQELIERIFDHDPDIDENEILFLTHVYPSDCPTIVNVPPKVVLDQIPCDSSHFVVTRAVNLFRAAANAEAAMANNNNKPSSSKDQQVSPAEEFRRMVKEQAKDTAAASSSSVVVNASLPNPIQTVESCSVPSHHLIYAIPTYSNGFQPSSTPTILNIPSVSGFYGGGYPHDPNTYQYYGGSEEFESNKTIVTNRQLKNSRVHLNLKREETPAANTIEVVKVNKRNTDTKIIHASFSADKTLEVKPPSLRSSKFFRRNSTTSFPTYSVSRSLQYLEDELKTTDPELEELFKDDDGLPKQGQGMMMKPSSSKKSGIKPKPIIEIREGDELGTRSGVKREFLCVFCKGNNEPESVYTSHPIRVNGIVMCPFLRNHTCVICKETGHTIKYCKSNKRGFFAMKSIGKADIFFTAEKTTLAQATASALFEATTGKVADNDKERAAKRNANKKD